VVEAPPNSSGMATGETTVEFLRACSRLVDTLDTPQDIPFLSGLIQREVVMPWRAPASGPAQHDKSREPCRSPGIVLMGSLHPKIILFA
jgi:hypothetical protein